MTANEKFFEDDKKAAAVLKHGVLRRYLAKFSGATSSTSSGKRVAYIDGYAGEGEYVNPRTGVTSEGSPAIALRIACDQASVGITLSCTFIEKDAESFTALESFVASHAAGSGRALQGDAREHLATVMQSCAGMPALVFIDPFGRGPDVVVTVKTILGRDDARPTELLLNLSIQAIRRIGARIWEAQGATGREATLAGLDEWMGGDWWRDIYTSEKIMLTPEVDRAHAAATAVAAAYVRKIADAAGCAAYAVPIRRKPSDKELFWLTLFCPRTLALWHFNEVVSLALKEWRGFLADVELAELERTEMETPGLFSNVSELQGIQQADERQIDRDAINDIKASVRKNLGPNSPLSTRSDLQAIFGPALGIGRETHLRTAWKELAAEGYVLPAPTGKLQNVLIHRA